MSRLLNKMREVPCLINKIMSMSGYYDNYTLVIEKLYAVMLHLEQPFYYKNGCLYETDSTSPEVLDPEYAIERYDFFSGESVFHDMVSQMGACNGCSHFQDYILKTDKKLIDKQIEDLGMRAVVGQVFEDLLPDKTYKDVNFTSYVIDECMSHRSNSTDAGYLLLTTKKNVSPRLCKEMNDLFGMYTTLFHFTYKRSHYFLYFFEEYDNLIGYTTINPCVYLAWMEAHKKGGSSTPKREAAI